jgi:hypothetical protein
MDTYFSANLKQKTIFEQTHIIRELAKLPEDTLATIQWNSADDELYSVSYLDSSITNTSDHGYIWTYLPAGQLLEEVIMGLQEVVNWDYNYNPITHKHFLSNANIITQFIDINDDDYENYLYYTALLYAVQIHREDIVDFEDYVKNYPIEISYEYATRYIMENERTNKEKNNEA